MFFKTTNVSTQFTVVLAEIPGETMLNFFAEVQLILILKIIFLYEIDKN